MTNRFLIPAWIILLILSLSFTTDDPKYVKKIKKHRKKQAKHFKKDADSPFVRGNIPYKPVPYYAPNEKYKVMAKLELTPEAKPFEMPTSTDRMAKYVKYGILTFELDGQIHQLSVYRNLRLADMEEYKDYLFLPFKDYTNGNGSYGGGRYLDMKVSGGDEMEIDFNLCYNPYCAYGDMFSCPIPPDENHLKIEIPAGVKVADKH
jgi:uncharacterized protein (DUF1684 family)